jgi:GT2 family glycosyltransferase
MRSNVPIDVIVPIFNAPDALAHCLATLDACTSPDNVRLWLMDDQSSDLQVTQVVRAFVARSKFRAECVRQEENLGFVANVNDALRRSTHDVLLLNSDTLVTPGWLDAIQALAAQLPSAASITPLSNNAEICSFPQFCKNNDVPNDLALHAQACAMTDEAAIELPTGVGFCMWMRRAALAQLGDLDAATFGRGYGEENDWCQRAIAWGWRNVLCNRAYVAHVGGQSFAATGEKPGGVNGARLLARYPHYDRAVQDFIARDPIRAVRAQVSATLAKLRAQK